MVMMSRIEGKQVELYASFGFLAVVVVALIVKRALKR